MSFLLEPQGLSHLTVSPSWAPCSSLIHTLSCLWSLRGDIPSVTPKSETLSLLPSQESTEMSTAMSAAYASKAAQACLPCRKQKRKCDKDLPACGLCSRMGRLCDYTDVQQAPTVEDLASMQQKIVELEQRLNEKDQQLRSGHASLNENTALSGGTATTPASLMNAVSEKPPLWTPAQSRSLSAMFLDIDCFVFARLPVPKPSADIPMVFLLISTIVSVLCLPSLQP